MITVPVKPSMWPARAGVLPPQLSVTIPPPLMTLLPVEPLKPGVAAPALMVLLVPARMRLLVQELLARAAEMFNTALLKVIGLAVATVLLLNEPAAVPVNVPALTASPPVITFASFSVSAPAP